MQGSLRRIFWENGKREVGCNRWASAQDVPRPAGIRDRRNERRKGDPTSRQSVTSIARSEDRELGTIGLLHQAAAEGGSRLVRCRTLDPRCAKAIATVFPPPRSTSWQVIDTGPWRFCREREFSVQSRDSWVRPVPCCALERSSVSWVHLRVCSAASSDRSHRLPLSVNGM